MDFDLEDELAAAAGRGDDSAKRRRSVEDLSASEAEEEEDDEDDEDYEEEGSAHRGKGKKGGAVPLKKRRVGGGKKAASSDSDEEGELQESGDEDEEEEGEDVYGDGFGEDLYKDQEDRRKLAAMTELEREMILAERAEQRDKLKERRLNALQAQKAAGTKAKKDKGRASKQAEKKLREDDEIEAMYVRTSSRQVRRESAKDRDLQALQKSRETRLERSGTREEKAKAKAKQKQDWAYEDDEEDVAPSDEGTDDDEEERDTRDYDRDGRRDYLDEEDDEVEDATYEEALSVQLRRDRLEKWVNEVFFNEVVEECLVRLATPAEGGGTGYVIAQIKRVTENKRDDGSLRSYEITKGGMKTDKLLECMRGNSSKAFEMSQVSSRPFTKEEFEIWQRFCRKIGAKTLTRGDVNIYREQIKRGESFKYTAQDVQQLIMQKKMRGQGRINVVTERTRLQNMLDHAEMEGNEEEAEDARRQLAELGRKAEKIKEMRESSNRSDFSSINSRNAFANFQELQSAGQKEALIASSGWGADEDQGAFSRRKTRPMTYWKTKAGEEPQKSGSPSKLDGMSPVMSAEEELANRIRKKKELRDAMEEMLKKPLEVDLSRLEEPTPEGILAKKLLGRHWEQSVAPYTDEKVVGNQRTLTLAEYKRLIT